MIFTRAQVSLKSIKELFHSSFNTVSENEKILLRFSWARLISEIKMFCIVFSLFIQIFNSAKYSIQELLKEQEKFLRISLLVFKIFKIFNFLNRDFKG